MSWCSPISGSMTLSFSVLLWLCIYIVQPVVVPGRVSYERRIQLFVGVVGKPIHVSLLRLQLLNDPRNRRWFIACTPRACEGLSIPPALTGGPPRMNSRAHGLEPGAHVGECRVPYANAILHGDDIHGRLTYRRLPPSGILSGCAQLVVEKRGNDQLFAGIGVDVVGQPQILRDHPLLGRAGHLV